MFSLLWNETFINNSSIKISGFFLSSSLPAPTQFLSITCQTWTKLAIIICYSCFWSVLFYDNLSTRTATHSERSSLDELYSFFKSKQEKRRESILFERDVNRFVITSKSWQPESEVPHKIIRWTGSRTCVAVLHDQGEGYQQPILLGVGVRSMRFPSLNS